jgi:hypothetical protein
MKRFLMILVLGLLLGGCATSIDHVKQKELIDYGSIKLGMNFQDLILMLGEGGQDIYYYKEGKEKDLIAAIPRIEGASGWDYLGKSYTYVGESSKGSKQHPSNFTLVYFNIDIGVANQYLIDRLKEGKEKEQEIKDFEKYSKHYRYISWQKKQQEKQKKKEEDQLAKKTEPKKTEPKKTTPESTTTKDDEKLLEIASGTGFIVTGDGYFISNNHVVEICKELKTKKAGKVYQVDIIATDKVNDLAIGKIDLSGLKYIPLSSEGGVLGEEIIVSGYPLQGELSESVKITKGVISSLSGPGNNYAIMQIDAAVQPGNSGGPILNQYAEMVGVTVAKADTLYFLEKAGTLPENINFGIKVETVQAFVKGNNIQLSESTSSKSKSFSSAEISKVAADSTIHLQCWNTLAAAAKLAKGSKARNFLVDVK